MEYGVIVEIWRKENSQKLSKKKEKRKHSLTESPKNQYWINNFGISFMCWHMLMYLKH